MYEVYFKLAYTTYSLTKYIDLQKSDSPGYENSSGSMGTGTTSIEEKVIQDPVTPLPDTPQAGNRDEDLSEIPATGETPRYVPAELEASVYNVQHL